jgi:hypothetical protein
MAATSDRKPPRLAGDERGTLVALLQYQRSSVVRKVDGVAEADAARSVVGSGTTLRWLVAHLADAERTWVLARFAGLDPGPSVAADPAVTLAAAVAAYRATWSEVDAVVAAAPSLDEPCRGLAAGEEPADLRWVLSHLLEETARHAGHADILRELLDGATGR